VDYTSGSSWKEEDLFSWARPFLEGRDIGTVLGVTRKEGVRTHQALGGAGRGKKKSFVKDRGVISD